MEINFDAADGIDVLKQQIEEFAENKIKKQDLGLFLQLVDVFLHRFSIEEWDGRKISDIYGCFFGLWHYAKHNPANGMKVSVFNPNLDIHGWLCNRTIITVIQKDMPFLVDSIRIELNRRELPINVVKSSVMNVKRDEEGIPLSFEVSNTKRNEDREYQKEALIYIEISLHTDGDELEEIRTSVAGVLHDVATAVSDYAHILDKLRDATDGLRSCAGSDEFTDFLEWLPNSHFTFLGYREFDLIDDKSGKALKEVNDRRLGIFRKLDRSLNVIKSDEFSDGMSDFYASSSLISFSKSSKRCNVHRAVYPDYIVVKKVNEKGEYCGERRFLGLFTYAVYSITPREIPILRKKVDAIVARSGIERASHDGQNLNRVIENFPRDELFQSDEDSLYENIMTVASINERHVVRLIMRKDVFGSFVHCMAFVPKDVYNTQIRVRIQGLLGEALNSEELDATTYFSESILARAQFVFRVDDKESPEYDVKELEAGIVEITRNWDDHLRLSLLESYGERKGIRYYREFKNAFSDGYREQFDARTAVNEIRMLERLGEDCDISMNFYQPVGASSNSVRFKVMHRDSPLELSDVIPILENLGLRVIGEHPYEIKKSDGQSVWLHDFTLKFGLPINLDVNEIRQEFEQAFAAVWRGEAESDDFNRLVLGAKLNWREVSMLRAYAAYMKQTAFVLTRGFIADTLAHHLSITEMLVDLFKAYFKPGKHIEERIDAKRIDEINRLNDALKESLEGVDNLSEDKVVRRYMELIVATLRTNFFQPDKEGNHKSYISLKFSPRDIPDIPEPRPMFEIFVYSPRIEGVHLRGGKVARGGLRWSDRLQDYRTEVLGLVKAQQVKNAVIVPNGAKGGFVAKKLPVGGTREVIFEEGVACYKLFIQGLLDLTDNLLEGKVVPPLDVIRHDDDDPYLVVAADKGTATFSDIANAISIDYKHWLGDAFASGGSKGYDHKGMGITAKGAWVSVQRHFREMGIDIQNEDFTVIGIGDMGGDVFGNGMLLSEHICLTAAFNHMHIFVDPSPDAAKSFVERKRLFETPRTTWQDYNKDLISKGGGVFSRAAKSIKISPEMKKCFGITKSSLPPVELINALLKAPVDLIWNGGIGTYIKSEKETHAQVGDKANDGLRVNGSELQCKVFGEGGNLGATQLGRVEFCLRGGSCNTDFIDNAAGVDCSDHEVNIKILLDELLANGDLNEKQRNKILADMTDSVSDLVLQNNYRQTQAISIASFQKDKRFNEYRRFMNYLESQGRLNRDLEYLPSDDELLERQGQGRALTRPELSVLISYAKVVMKEELITSDIADDDYVAREIESAFPAKIRKEYKKEMYDHRLRREIVGTQVANDLINNLGITVGHRLYETTGASTSEIAKAYIVSRDVFEFEAMHEYVKSLDNKVPSEFQSELMSNMIRRVRRGTRWFLRNRRSGLDISHDVDVFFKGLNAVHEATAEAAEGTAREDWLARRQVFEERDVPEKWAIKLSMPNNLFSGLGIVEAGLTSGIDYVRVTETYFLLLDRLNLNWFATQLSEVHVETYWQAQARESYIDDLEAQLRILTVSIVLLAEGKDLEEVVQAWMETNKYLIERWKSMVNEVQGAQITDYAMFSVALRELIDLAQATKRCSDIGVDACLNIDKAS